MKPKKEFKTFDIGRIAAMEKENSAKTLRQGIFRTSRHSKEGSVTRAK